MRLDSGHALRSDAKLVLQALLLLIGEREEVLPHPLCRRPSDHASIRRWVFAPGSEAPTTCVTFTFPVGLSFAGS